MNRVLDQQVEVPGLNPVSADQAAGWLGSPLAHLAWRNDEGGLTHVSVAHDPVTGLGRALAGQHTLVSPTLDDALDLSAGDSELLGQARGTDLWGLANQVQHEGVYSDI